MGILTLTSTASLKAMDEAQLQQALEAACQDPDLCFQVIQEPPYLHVYINRESHARPDYTALGETIRLAIAALYLPDIAGIFLYSRIMGEVDPDWQGYVELQDSLAFSDTEEMVTESLTEGMVTLPLYVNPFDVDPVSEVATNGKESTSDSPQQAAAIASSQTETSAPVEEVEPVALESVEPLLDAAAIASSQTETSAPVEEVEPVALESVEPPLDAAAIASSQTETSAPVEEVEPLGVENSEVENVEVQVSPWSEYCFIRNKSLLAAEIMPPSGTISELVNAFNAFSATDKQQLLPTLEQFYLGNGESFTFPEALAAEPKQWLETVTQLDEEKTRKAAIWLSRYCFNPQETMDIVAAKLAKEAAIAAARVQSENAQAEKAQMELAALEEALESPKSVARPSRSRRKFPPLTQKVKAIALAWVLFILAGVASAHFIPNPLFGRTIVGFSGGTFLTAAGIIIAGSLRPIISISSWGALYQTALIIGSIQGAIAAIFSPEIFAYFGFTLSGSWIALVALSRYIKGFHLDLSAKLEAIALCGAVSFTNAILLSILSAIALLLQPH